MRHPHRGMGRRCVQWKNIRQHSAMELAGRAGLGWVMAVLLLLYAVYAHSIGGAKASGNHRTMPGHGAQAGRGDDGCA